MCRINDKRERQHSNREEKELIKANNKRQTKIWIRIFVCLLLLALRLYSYSVIFL